MTEHSSNAALSRESPNEISIPPVVSSTGLSYRPFLELGEGGMAKVFLASAVGPAGFNKLVVLKSMRASDLGDDAIRQMFADEARLSARFNHPNLVQVHEVNLAAEPPYLVMEYLDGKPLSALRDNERITPSMRLVIISEMLTGLHYAHELSDFDGSSLGIVHRDVSPHNVFVTYDGAVKVLDFGIAKQVTSNSRTAAGEIKGKLAYMAPEQMLGSELDRRADIFSVGSMLWETAVGRRMWDGMGDATLMHRLATGDIPRPGTYAAVDAELEEIIVKATAANADDRYQNALELQNALDAYIARAGERASVRQIGATLADAFQTERRRLAEIVSSALKQSLSPPPMTDADAEATATQVRPARAPLLVIAGLVLLAFIGFLAPRFSRSQPQEAAPPRAAEKPDTGTLTGATERAAALPPPHDARPQAAPSAEIAAVASVAPSSEPSSGSKQRHKPTHRVERAAAPAPAVVPTEAPQAAPPKQTPEDQCSPPYYFVRGIKTYKPECL